MLLLVQICSVVELSYGISVCSTAVYIDSDRRYHFHVDEYRDLETTAKEFCDIHAVPSSECRRIVLTHTARCFPLHATPDPHDNVEISEEDFIKNPVESPLVDVIDYSQKVGPVLQVHDARYTGSNGVVNCQAFLGEMKARTVKRCCIALALSAEHCQLLEGEYNKLLTRGEMGRDSTENVADADTFDRSSSTQRRGMFDSFVDSVNRFTSTNWNWILLVVSIFYVMLNHNR